MIIIISDREKGGAANFIFNRYMHWYSVLVYLNNLFSLARKSSLSACVLGMHGQLNKRNFTK